MNSDFQIRAGELRHPISVRIRPTATTGGVRAANGEIDTSLPTTDTWEVRCTPRAAVDTTKGIELQRSDRPVSELWTLFVILYRADIPQATDRIIWRSRIFDVISVVDVEGKDRRLDIQTIEVK